MRWETQYTCMQSLSCDVTLSRLTVPQVVDTTTCGANSDDKFGPMVTRFSVSSLRWRHNDYDGVSNHQLHGCLLNRLFRRRSKKTSKLRVTGLCVGNSPGPVNSPHKGPVTRKMFPFDDVIMLFRELFTVCCALLWFGIGQFKSYPSGLLKWHWVNLTIAPLPGQQPWRIWEMHPINSRRNYVYNINTITKTVKQAIQVWVCFIPSHLHDIGLYDGKI